MAFKTDGSTHTSGINNELNTIKLLNEHFQFSEPLEHLGGTKNKADADNSSRSNPYSIKEKQGLKNGSFDWVNTSRTEMLVSPERFAEFFALMRTVREWETDRRAAMVDEIRDLFAELCDNALKAIDSQALTAWLQAELINANHGMSMAITDTKAARCYVMSHDAILAAKLLAAGYVARIETGKGSTSRKVVLVKGSEVVECGLRLRVTSNNGIKAFMGLSKANRNSQVVLKLQQDRVDQLVATASNVTEIAF